MKPLLTGFDRVLDPFAGPTGTSSSPNTWGVEIEPEWCGPRTVVGDAQALPFRDCSFDAVATSPCYGNRMADHHNAQDGSRRHTYTHTMGHELNCRSAATLQWGKAYRRLHEHAWSECYRVLRPFGILVLNVSDHVRAGRVQPVSQWHVDCLTALDFVLIDEITVETPRLRDGENHELRVGHESVLVFLRKAGIIVPASSTIAVRLLAEGRGPV